MKDILEGLTFLKSKRIAHRDIKPENIVMMNNKAVIIDLGLAVFVDEDPYYYTRCGTPGFISPEVI